MRGKEKRRKEALEGGHKKNRLLLLLFPPPTTIFSCDCSTKVWSGATTSLASRLLPSQPQQPDRGTQSLSTHLFSLSLSLTHSHTRAHRQRCRPHTHAAGIPARLCRAHDISMFYRCRKLLSARPAAVSGLHRFSRTHRRGVRGPPRVPTPVGFWPPPKRANMTSRSQRGTGFGFPLPKLFSFSFLLLQLEHPPQHFF